MEPNESQAQGQPTGAESQTPEATEQNGVEKRIGQLVAEREAEKSRAAVLEQQVLQLTSQMAHLVEVTQQRSQPQVPVETPPDIDPEEMKKLEYVAKRVFGGEIETLRKTVRDQAAQLSNVQGQATVSKYHDLPPEIVKAAEKLVRDVNAAGIPYNMEDAIKHQLGEYWLKDRDAKNGRSATERAKMNGKVPVLSFQGSPPPAVASQVQRVDLPPNFNQLSPKDQLKILRQRGVEDAPI